MRGYSISMVDITDYSTPDIIGAPKWDIIAKQRAEVRRTLRELYTISRHILLGNEKLSERTYTEIQRKMYEYLGEYHTLAKLLSPENNIQKEYIGSHPIHYLLQLITQSFFEDPKKIKEVKICKGYLQIHTSKDKNIMPAYQIITPNYPVYLSCRIKNPKSLLEKALTGAKTLNDILGFYIVAQIPENLKENYASLLRKVAQNIGKHLEKERFMPIMRKPLRDVHGKEYYPLLYRSAKTKFIIYYLGNYSEKELKNLVKEEIKENIYALNKEGLYLIKYNVNNKKSKEKYLILEVVEGEKEKVIKQIINALCIYRKEYQKFEKMKYTKEVHSQDLLLIPTGIFNGLGLERVHVPFNHAMDLIKKLPYKIIVKKEENKDIGVRDYLGDNKKPNGYEAIHINYGIEWKGELIEIKGKQFYPILPFIEVQLTEMEKHANNKLGKASHKKYKKNTANQIKEFWESLVPCHSKRKKISKKRMYSIEEIFKEINNTMSQWNFPELSYP